MEHKLLYLRSIQALEYTFYTNGWINKRLYYERLLQELAVIALADYAGYFKLSLILFHDQGIMSFMLTWTGSATRSLMAYCLGITQVDSLQHGLLFERFLNLSRNNIPDIDIDFCQRNRENVIRYA
ncbi:MAG: hypothetical protein ACTS45_01875 [Candidatus Hodgkinia cicadicola]